MNIFSSNLAFLPVAISIMGSILCILASKKYSHLIAITSMALAISSTICLIFQLGHQQVITYHFGGWVAPYGIEYLVNYQNVIILMVILIVATSCLLYDLASFEETSHIFLLSVAGMSGMCLSNDIFNIYVFMEIAAISSYILIVNEDNKESKKCALNYLIIGTIATSFILLGIGLIYIKTGTLNLTDLKLKIAIIQDQNVILSGYLLIILGILIKLGIFPFNKPIEDVYSNSPRAITAFFMGASNKIYIYLMFKFLSMILLTDIYLQYLMYFALAAIIISNIIALKSSGIKLLTYSSLGQISYLILLISIIPKTSYAALAIFLGIINHSCAKSSLVMLFAGNHQNNMTKILSLINLASLVGLPISLGFIFKWGLLLSLADSRTWLALVIVVISGFCSFIYYFRMWKEFDHLKNINKESNISPIFALTFINIALLFYTKEIIRAINL